MVQAVQSSANQVHTNFISSSLDALAAKVKSFVNNKNLARIGEYISLIMSAALVIASTYCVTVPLTLGYVASAIGAFAISRFLRTLRFSTANLGLLKDPNFRKVLKDEIFPLYIKHEKTFDSAHVHGRMHISRCIIYTLAMLNFYKKHFNIQADEMASLYTIALHDAGRKGNGIDLWEKDSERLAKDHLRKHGYSWFASRNFAKAINKANHVNQPEAIAVRSADCFDIMRPCCGHNGRSGFAFKFLDFLNPAKDPLSSNLSPDEANKIRHKLIDEAWEFIKITEAKKYGLRNSDSYFEDVVYLLESNQSKFPTLFGLLKK